MELVGAVGLVNLVGQIGGGLALAGSFHFGNLDEAAPPYLLE
jgi:hypothetical protein